MTTRPLRLLAVTATGEVSGAERVLLRVLQAAADRGWPVRCAAPTGRLTGALPAGVRHVPVPDLVRGSGPAATVRTLVRWGRAAWRIRRAARGADVVLANSLGALPVLRLASPRAPVVWLAHDVLVAPDRLRLFRASRGVLARVAAVSAAVAQPLGDRVPVTVVHNGVPWPVAPAVRRTDGTAPVAGINALLTPWKGHRVLLDAVGRLPDDVRVEVMGGQLPTDDAHAADLRRRIAQAPWGDRVRLLGHLDDPLERMRGWTVAISASTDPEACPLNVLEAMSLGVPVVATGHGGSPEVLAGSGLLVPPGDAAALADAVTRLIRDDDLWRRCADAGRERVAAAHRLEVQTAALLRVLEQEAGTG